MIKHCLTPANAKNMDAVIDQIAVAADGTPFPGGFLTSARQADPSGAAAAQAVRSAAGQETAIEAVKAGAPDAGGGKSSSKDALIFRLGRSAVAKAGTTGWPAYEQAALESQQTGGKHSQKKAAIEAVKAGAPDAGGGKSSTKDALIFKLGRSAVAEAGTTGWQAYDQAALEARQKGGHTASIMAVEAGAPDAAEGRSSRADVVIFRMSGGDKSSATTWKERQDLARTVKLTGSKKGGQNNAKNQRIAAMALPIVTHSHECMDPQCRRPVKCLSKFVNGKMYTTFSHHCHNKDGKHVDGLGKHMCSTCHQTGRVCKDAICRYSKCTTSTSACAHLHDGSGVTRV